MLMISGVNKVLHMLFLVHSRRHIVVDKFAVRTLVVFKLVVITFGII